MKSKNPWKLDILDEEGRAELLLRAWIGSTCFTLVIIALSTLAALAAVGFVAYRLLLHFGIL